MKDCASRCYFPSVRTEVGLHVAKLLSSVHKDGKLCDPALLSVRSLL